MDGGEGSIRHLLKIIGHIIVTLLLYMSIQSCGQTQQDVFAAEKKIYVRLNSINCYGSFSPIAQTLISVASIRSGQNLNVGHRSP